MGKDVVNRLEIDAGYYMSMIGPFDTERFVADMRSVARTHRRDVDTLGMFERHCLK
jgi:hypothetical protein